jgi:hypothetical protein
MLTLLNQRSVIAMIVALAALVAAATPLPDITSQTHLIDGLLAVITGIAAVVAGFAKPPAPEE